VLEKLLSP